MIWIYLSPHLDDVAFSCGGLLWEQAQQGENVQVWTLCTGDPPEGVESEIVSELHARWGMESGVMEGRRREDRASCARLSAASRHFDVPDCIYRLSPIDGRPLYPNREAIFGEVHAEDEALIERLRARLEQEVPQEAVVVCPLALGNHIDHQITRAALERAGRARWYYADYPYVREQLEALARLEQAGWTPVVFPIGGAGLQAWVEAAAAHASQISSFWRDEEELRVELRSYHQQVGGIRLWRCKTEHLF